MTQLEVVVYNKEHASLNRVAEIHGTNIYSTIPFDIYKTTMVLFVTEILRKILREEEPNPELYRFLEESMTLLDRTREKYFNFHVQFLLKLTRYFGIEPASLNEMVEQILELDKNYLIPDKIEEHVRSLLNKPMGELISINNDHRRELIELVILYYKSHFDQLHVIKSYDVLKEVFEK
jgi:DNA repair protein RecO (recombination protein O)